MVLSEGIVQLNDANFHDTVKRSKRLLVDCWAPWCGPCKMLAPTFEALAKDYNGKLVFAKLDTDESPQTAMALGIRSIPTLIMFKDGKQVESVTGWKPREALEAMIKKHL